jgi:hypothetical protein
VGGRPEGGVVGAVDGRAAATGTSKGRANGSGRGGVGNNGDIERLVCGEEESAVSGVRDELPDDGDEVGAGPGEGGMVVCLNDMKPF